MGSKKHYSPRYHKARDLARLAASPTSSSRKQYRELKSRKHRTSRALSRTNLAVIAKTRCFCDDENVSACPRCDKVAPPIIMNRRVSHGSHDNLKYVRWGSDKLNPGLRWARVIKARHGDDALTSRLREMTGAAGDHLKFHIRFGETVHSQPGCGKHTLKRVFKSLGLHYGSDTNSLLLEVARFAYLHNAERQLATWTQVYTGMTVFSNGCLWMPVQGKWWVNHHPQGSTSIHLPLRNDSPVGFEINEKWRITPEELRPHECASGANRPLHSLDDIWAWSDDMTRFFDTFYARNYFSTAYGRWVLRYTLSYLRQKGQK
jgi:hypothetical protein